MSNESGIYPVEYKVLIEPEEVEEKTEGGIILPDKVKEQEYLAQVRGKVVAIGGNAFEEWKGLRPEVGNMVYVAKYSGLRVIGNDGKTYQIAHDKDIAAVIKEEKNG